MEGFIHAFNKGKKSFRLPDIKHLIKKYKYKDITVEESSNNKIHSVYFTNEFDEYPYGEKSSVFFTPVGNFVIDRNDIKSSLLSANKDYQKQYVNKLAGTFALAYANFDLNEILLFTHIARIETVFLYEDTDIIIIGTDPLIISLISNNGDVKFDVTSMYSFVLNGYYADDKTPFLGVNALPANSRVEINESGVEIEQLDDIFINLLDTDFSDKDFDDLTNDFLDAFNTQPNNRRFRMALTGGKDSRLIFAAMNSNNFELETFTNGFSDNPDVEIGRRISELYDIPHNIKSPKISEENTITVNLYKKIKTVMMSTSGMVYGYEKGTMPGRYRGERSFDGVGAELVKGGYAAFINTDESSNKKKLVDAFSRKSNLLHNGTDNKFNQFLKTFITDEKGLNKLQILYSLQYRSGRLTSAARNGTSYITSNHSPFLDNKFLKKSLKLNYNSIKNEDVHYEILKRLDKRLLDVPFAKDRWRREKLKPESKDDYKKWLQRSPYFPTSQLGNYNWRKLSNNDETLIQPFKDIILSNPNHMIYEIVDYKKIQKLFEKPFKFTDTRFLWSLASIIVFVNELSEDSNKQFNYNIQMKIPSTKISNYKNKKEIIDISNDFVPTNKSLDVDNNIVKVITTDKHRKLSLFKGGIKTSPTELDISEVSKLRIYISIDNLSENYSLRMQVILYKNNKIAKSEFIDPIINTKMVEFEYKNFDVTQFDSFRVLIILKNSDLEDEYKINYCFYEITY